MPFTKHRLVCIIRYLVFYRIKLILQMEGFQLATDKMYELAFEYKKTKLWKRLHDNELFAVKFSDGVIGYCCIMGMADKLYSFMVYLGEKGFQSYREIATLEMGETEFEYRERLLSQDCLQCVFDNKESLSEEEFAEVQKYAKDHGVSIRGRNAYPHFARFRPKYYPWRLDDEKEQGYLCEALQAAVVFGKYLENHNEEEAGLKFVEEVTELPLLERENDIYLWKNTEIPNIIPTEYPRPKVVSDLMAAKLKKAPKGRAWECELIRMLSPVQEDEQKAPYFPVMLFAVERGTNYLLPIAPVMYYEEHPEELLNVFVEALLKENIRPSALLVRNERTLALLEELCRKAKISLSICEELPSLDMAEADFLDEFGPDGERIEEEDRMKAAEDMLDYLLNMEDSQVDDLPDVLKNQLLTLADFGELSDELSNKIRQLFSKKTKKGGKKRKKAANLPEKSYVISVSLYTGCYRHIQISSKMTLYDLHKVILDAFGFDDDHGHAFFMDNVRWSHFDSYFSDNMDEEDNVTKDHKLEEVGLEAGKKFKYLFDFGDEWMFQCKVLRILEKITPQARIVRSKGEAPEQYPDWED